MSAAAEKALRLDGGIGIGISAGADKSVDARTAPLTPLGAASGIAPTNADSVRHILSHREYEKLYTLWPRLSHIIVCVTIVPQILQFSYFTWI